MVRQIGVIGGGGGEGEQIIKILRGGGEVKI